MNNHQVFHTIISQLFNNQTDFYIFYVVFAKFILSFILLFITLPNVNNQKRHIIQFLASSINFLYNNHYTYQSFKKSMKTSLSLITKKQTLSADAIYNQFLSKDVSPRLSSVKIKLKGLSQQKFCIVIEKIGFKARFITYLALQGNKLTEQSIKTLVKTGWKFIQSLNLSKNQIKGTSLQHLKEVDWKYLRTFDLSLNPIRNKGIQNLCKCNFPKLQHLLMKKTLVTSSCFRSLAKAQWKGLKQLNFCQCQLGKIDLSFLGYIQWGKNCMIDLHTDDSRPVFGWCNSLAKAPITMSELKIFLCSGHTALNNQASINCLKKVFPNTSNFHMLWSTDRRRQGGGVEYFMASSDDS